MNALFRALARGAYRLSIGANALGTLSVLAMVVVVNYDVLMRNAFTRPFMGAVEVVQFSLVFIVFLQLPDVVRVGKLTRSDGFLLLIGKRFPKAARALQRAIDALAALFMALVAYAIWPEFVEMLETRDYFGVPGVFTAPWWPIKFVIFASGALCCALFLIRIVLGNRSPFAPPGDDVDPSASVPDVASATRRATG